MSGLDTDRNTDSDTQVTAGRRRVGPADLLWLTWKQHRWALGLGAAFALALSGYLVWTTLEVMALAAECSGDCRVSRSTEWFELRDPYSPIARTTFGVMSAFALIVGLFWAAPLLAREYEQRTDVLAWTQDVSPSRWMWGKVASLAAAAAVLAVVLGAAGDALSSTVDDSFGSYSFDGRFVEMEAAPLPQLGYALFALSVGLLAGAVLRRTLPAMASTLVVFCTVRFLVSLVRPYFLAPVRHTQPLAGDAIGLRPPIVENGMILDNGALDAAGNPYVAPYSCGEDSVGCVPPDTTTITQFFDYQPADRLELFRAIECGIFLVLAAGLLAVTWWWVRRADAA